MAEGRLRPRPAAEGGARFGRRAVCGHAPISRTRPGQGGASPVASRRFPASRVRAARSAPVLPRGRDTSCSRRSAPKPGPRSSADRTEGRLTWQPRDRRLPRARRQASRSRSWPASSSPPSPRPETRAAGASAAPRCSATPPRGDKDLAGRCLRDRARLPRTRRHAARLGRHDDGAGGVVARGGGPMPSIHLNGSEGQGTGRAARRRARGRTGIGRSSGVPQAQDTSPPAFRGRKTMIGNVAAPTGIEPVFPD
jgi:hypothetical protein